MVLPSQLSLSVTSCRWMGPLWAPRGGLGRKELGATALCNHKQRLECILKRAASEEQVGGR